MGRLDRYVGRIFVGAWCASLVFLLLISVLVDLLNGLGGYIDKADKAGLGTLGLLWQLLVYYLQLIPFFFVTVAPFVTVIAGMFAMARLMASHELHPMLFAGRSMARVLRPMLVAAAASGALMAGCWQWVLPAMGEALARSQSTLQGAEATLEGVVMEPKDGAVRRLHVRTYYPDTRRMVDVSMLIEGSGTGDAALVRAPEARWDERVGDWRLTDGLVRRGQSSVSAREWLQEPALTPEAVRQQGRSDLEPEVLGYDELLEVMRLRPQRADVRMAWHRHITYPLANLVLLMLALPFTIHFERRSRIERVLGAILICGAYLLTDLTCQSLGLRGYVQPVVAAWAPTILFGSLGVVLFGSLKT